MKCPYVSSYTLKGKCPIREMSTFQGSPWRSLLTFTPGVSVTYVCRWAEFQSTLHSSDRLSAPLPRGGNQGNKSRWQWHRPCSQSGSPDRCRGTPEPRTVPLQEKDKAYSSLEQVQSPTFKQVQVPTTILKQLCTSISSGYCIRLRYNLTWYQHSQ